MVLVWWGVFCFLTEMEESGLHARFDRFVERWFKNREKIEKRELMIGVCLLFFFLDFFVNYCCWWGLWMVVVFH